MLTSLYVALLLIFFSHIHLHIISDDFQGSGMKKKRHYNSFNPHPESGYFLRLKTVLQWFEAVPEFYELVGLEDLFFG